MLSFWPSRQVQQQVQQPVKYHGLINHGSTCYLNSVLQVLFMTKEFREAVNRFVEENPDTQFIDRHLKDLFDDLLRHQAYTYKIIKALGIDRVDEQQDAANCFERILNLTSSNTAEIFHGQMVLRTTCSVCEAKRDRDKVFWHLPLELKDSSSGNYSVEDGINTYFRPADLGEDHQMYCGTCDTKVNVTSRYVIKHHPDVLILLLKRFDFSYCSMSHIKINRPVDVPFILRVPEDQTYELYGVVNHYGDLKSGHFIAKIKSQEDDEETWFIFDDTEVSRLNCNPFPGSVNITQSQSAYLLFYRKKVQQPVKYHGLINHGSTCYLNSVLQVLFMTKEFREAVNRFVEENPDTQFIDRHLKDLFDDLMKHQSYTYKIIKALGINRVDEQQDAAEYFERILKQTSSNTAEMFHGQMAHRTTCSVCETESDRDKAFWHLPLELMDSSSGNYSVEDGINTYFRPTYLGGDNQMYCDTCDAKVNATSRYVIKHHPDVLILLLKRFDFSYRHMSYVKINCAVDVPYTLTVPEDQTYELYGVVNHSGDRRSGHYIAQIKSQEEEETWYSFDDTRVAALYSSPFPDSVNITQFQSAYLLFYRKKGSMDLTEVPSDKAEEVKNSPDLLSEEISAGGSQQKRILELEEEVKKLHIQNAEKDERLALLERRVAVLEQYMRMNNVIVTEHQVNPHSYAQAVNRGGGETSAELNITSTKQ